MGTTKRLHTPNATLATRLAAGLVRMPNGCLEWTKYCAPTSGYGIIGNSPGPQIGVHVAAWLVGHGLVPIGELVRHRCDNPPCGDLDHLLLGTDADNIQDMLERGRSNVWGQHGKCAKGLHELSDEYRDHKGWRYCRPCYEARVLAKSQALTAARTVCPSCSGPWTGVTSAGNRYCSPCASARAVKREAARRLRGAA